MQRLRLLEVITTTFPGRNTWKPARQGCGYSRYRMRGDLHDGVIPAENFGGRKVHLKHADARHRQEERMVPLPINWWEEQWIKLPITTTLLPDFGVVARKSSS